MNNQVKPEEDLLHQYIDRKEIEKAPEGFTTETMTKILAEASLAANLRKKPIRNRVPLISVVVTTLLILSAFLLRHEEAGISGWKVSQFLPEFNFQAILDKIYPLVQTDLPGWLPYLALCIALLALFDRALFTFTYRGKNRGVLG